MLLVFFFLAAATPRIFAVIFDLEDAIPTSHTYGPHPGAYVFLRESNSGLTMTLSRQTAPHAPWTTFDVTNNQFTMPVSFGYRSLNPFTNSSAKAFIANFSAPLSGFALEFGNFGALGVTYSLTLNAYTGLNGTGTLLGSVTVPWSGCLCVGESSMASFSGLSGIQSVTFMGGNAEYPNGMYYDNFIATPESTVPEGNTFLLLASGLPILLLLHALSSRRQSG